MVNVAGNNALFVQSLILLMIYYYYSDHVHAHAQHSGHSGCVCGCTDSFTLG